jgi:hypothetical protein
MSGYLRPALAAAIVWYALGMPGLPVTPGGGGGGTVPYAGTLSALHAASRSMDAADRASLSEALTAAGEMLRADSRGLVDTTEAAQRYVSAVLEFSYNGLGQPKQRYPAVADAISAEMLRVVGDTAGAFDAAGRARLAESLAEAGRATR